MQFFFVQNGSLTYFKLFLFDETIDRDIFCFVSVRLLVEDFFQFKQMILIRTDQQETAVLFQDAHDLLSGDRRKDGQDLVGTFIG